jgi:hypothetical protein
VKRKGFESNRTTVDKINSAVYYSGQYLPTRDDGVSSPILKTKSSHPKKRTIQQIDLLEQRRISSFILDNKAP